MIRPTGVTVAVADGETVRLFHNTAVKPGVHLVEITAAPSAPARAGSGARQHTSSANPDGRRLVEDDFAAATAAFLNKLSLTVPVSTWSSSPIPGPWARCASTSTAT
jgi:protein required for attachment to host cells